MREAWDRVETVLDLDVGASNLRLSIDAPSGAPVRCLFVDDVVLTRE